MITTEESNLVEDRIRHHDKEDHHEKKGDKEETPLFKNIPIMNDDDDGSWLVD